eukprot:1681770-Prymnesium_polylepis.1
MGGHNWVGESPSGFRGWTREMSEVPPPFIQSLGTRSLGGKVKYEEGISTRFDSVFRRTRQRNLH